MTQDEAPVVELHWSLFDSAFHTPTGSHWTWFSPALTAEQLDALYYEVLADEFRSLVNVHAASVVKQGFASIDNQWCCWFRLTDAGRDNRGRPGRYIIAAAFAARPQPCALDAQQVFELPAFDAIAALCGDAPPLPTPKTFVTRFKPKSTTVPAEVLDEVQSNRPITLPVGRARLIAGYCATSTRVKRWNCLESATADSAKLTVTYDPFPQSLPDTVDEPEAVQVDVPAAEVNTPKKKKRWFMWSVLLLAVLTVLTGTAIVASKRIEKRVGRSLRNSQVNVKGLGGRR